MEIRPYNFSFPPEYRDAIEEYALERDAMSMKNATLELMRYALREKGIKLSTERKIEVPVVVRGYRLPENADFPPVLMREALDLGLTEGEAREEWKLMCAWSSDKSNMKGAKRNWAATWRNWVKKSVQNKKMNARKKFEMPEVYVGGDI